ASRSPNEGFRFLSSYREFEGTLAPDFIPDAGVATTRIRTLYKKIDEEERHREKKEKQPQEKSWVADWPTLLYQLAIIVLGGAFVFVAMRLLIRWIFSAPIAP